MPPKGNHPRSHTIDEFKVSENYHNSFLIPHDESIEYALTNSVEKGLPEISVGATQGKFMQLVARAIGAKRILEVGTLGGYSTIWMARALPDDGYVLSFEIDPKRAEVARENAAHAGVGHKVKVVVGAAADSLKELSADESFDMAFIDADKENNITYLLEAKRLLRKNGIIIVDNAVFGGKIADMSNTSGHVEGVRKVLYHIKDDPELEATTIPTFTGRGWDGFIFVVRL